MYLNIYSHSYLAIFKQLKSCVSTVSFHWAQQEFSDRIFQGKGKPLSRVRLFATPWAVAYQAPPSMEFSRQEYWSGLPLPSPGDLPDPGIELGSPAWQADALPSEP